MGLLLWLCSMVYLHLYFSLFHAHVVANSFNTSSVQLSCHDDERSALLQFKQSFVIKRYASIYEDAYPKVLSWKSEGESSNCCFWDGVECDEKTGHVIGLILNSSCLYGSINSNSTLFRLVHLQKLNLGDNHFNYSLIPSAIVKFSELAYLNLSNSRFSGQVPIEISHLSKLISLDLTTYSYPHDPSKPYWLLKLKNPNLRSLVQNLTSLEWLLLSSVYIPSTVPDFLANFTSLKGLSLINCGLYGKFPMSIFYLPNLKVLRLGLNKNLTGYLPEFHQRSPLELLVLSETGFSGSIPSSIENLESLKIVDLTRCSFSRPLPSSLGKLTQLTYLVLGENHLSGSIPSSFQKLTKLSTLDLSRNQMIGQIPSWIGNLSQLSALVLFGNNLSGSIPSSFQKLTKLCILDLSFNLFHGQLPIPPTSIQMYFVSNNLLKGEIPKLLCNLNSLQVLDLSSNKLSGMVPKCLGRLNSLSILNLRNNSFDDVIPPVCTSPSNLKMMDLSKNKFEGRLPRSLAACTMLEFLDVGQNQLTDVFPAWLGTLPEFKLLSLRHNGFYGVIKMPKQSLLFPKLRVIDLSYNCFTGELPFQYILFLSALKGINSSDSRYMEQDYAYTQNYGSIHFNYHYSTTIINKGKEIYYEGIQEIFAEIDFSCNKFNGEIPQFIGNLKALHSLNLSFNNLTGSIPLSLGNLTELESVDLSNNKLSGEIPQQLTGLTFLQFFDVSHNNLTGPIPQANQFGTFENTSFDGNPGLCGMPLSKKCKDSKTLALPPSAVEEDNDDSSIELDWKFVLAGCLSGFVVGVALGDMVITRRQRWFFKAFERISQRMEIRQWRN